MDDLESAVVKSLYGHNIDPVREWVKLHDEKVRANAVKDALALVNSMPERPERPSTHWKMCHQVHLACFVHRLRVALGGDTDTTRKDNVVDTEESL